jgi:hypothetical protein
MRIDMRQGPRWSLRSRVLLVVCYFVLSMLEGIFPINDVNKGSRQVSLNFEILKRYL